MSKYIEIIKPIWYIRWSFKVLRFIKFITMSERGYLNADREKRLARILDGLFDFKKRIKRKIFWGLIDLGVFLEKRDYRLFLLGIKIIDNGILAESKNKEAANILDKALDYLEERDIQGFNIYVSDLLAGKIDIPLVENDKEMFLSALVLLRGSINIALDKIKDLRLEAEAEQYK